MLVHGENHSCEATDTQNTELPSTMLHGQVVTEWPLHVCIKHFAESIKRTTTDKFRKQDVVKLNQYLQTKFY